jgi:hypothetical protein
LRSAHRKTPMYLYGVLWEKLVIWVADMVLPSLVTN